MKEKVYALYRGEENLMDGTLKEIAKKHGVKIGTLKWMTSPIWKKRKERAKHPRASLELVEIED